MNRKFFTNLLLFLITLQFACSDSANNQAGQPREIVFDDRLKIVKNDQTKEYEIASFDNQSLQNSTKQLADNSTLATMFDGAGNKTETRFFDNHPLIKTVILRTSARGEKQIFVYAQNGEIKNPPENTIDKALTAPANELAAAAGIFRQRKTEDFSDKNENPTPQAGILQPLPGYDFLPKIENEKSETAENETSKEKIKETKSAPETLAPWIEIDGKAQNPK